MDARRGALVTGVIDLGSQFTVDQRQDELPAAQGIADLIEGIQEHAAQIEHTLIGDPALGVFFEQKGLRLAGKGEVNRPEHQHDHGNGIANPGFLHQLTGKALQPAGDEEHDHGPDRNQCRRTAPYGQIIEP